MMMRPGSYMLLLVCVAGCSFDFTEPPRDVPAHFGIQVIADSRTGQLKMVAGVNPGVEIDGRRRSVLEDIRDGNVTIEPSQIRADGTRIYEAEWSLAEAVSGGGDVLMRAPVIEGLESIQQQPSLRVEIRAGPDSLFVTGDEPAVLTLEHRPPPAEDATGHWSLLLTDSIRGSHRSIQGVGPPPQEITIPRSLFDPQSRLYEASLVVQHNRSGEFILDRYIWSTNARSEIYWTIMFDQP
jgi:hypothetical protein